VAGVCPGLAATVWRRSSPDAIRQQQRYPPPQQSISHAPNRVVHRRHHDAAPWHPCCRRVKFSRAGIGGPFTPASATTRLDAGARIAGCPCRTVLPQAVFRGRVFLASGPSPARWRSAGRGGSGSFAAPSPPSAYALRRTPAQLRPARHTGAHAVPSDSCSSVRISSSCRNSSSNWPLVRPSLSRAHSS
jgi:hypothetical protein